MRITRVLFYLVTVSVAFVLSVGCGSGKKDAEPANKTAAKPAATRPAPGTMVSVETQPVTLESRWAWKDIWSGGRDLGHCTVSAVGMEQDAAAQDTSEYAVTEQDHYFVLSFGAEAFAADKCQGIRVHLPKSEYAGLWWAAESDVKPDSYPFAPERFAPLHRVEAGVFELDLAAAEMKDRLNGTIRFLRIDPCNNVGDTISLQQVEGKLARSSAWAQVEPLQANLKPSEADRAAGLRMRATVTNQPEDLVNYASALYYWRDAATETAREDLRQLGTKQATNLLDAGDAKRALQVFSAVARGSGNPVEYLHAMRDTLSEAQRAALWPKEPYLIIEDFSSPFARSFIKQVEGQGREVTKSQIDPAGSRGGGRSAMMDLTQAKKDGPSGYVIYVHIPLGEKPFAIRTATKENTPSETKLTIGYSFPSAKMSASSDDSSAETASDGWKIFDIRRDFRKERQDYAQSQGYDASDGRINVIGLNIPRGTANTWWMDVIEIYIPKSGQAATAEPTK